MKKLYSKTLLALTLVALSVSCNENFLDETPTQYVSSDDVAETGKIYANILAGSLTGASNTMYTLETGGTDTHEDYGQKGYDLIMDFLSGDLALSQNGYNRYRDIAQLVATVDNTFTKPNYMAWRYYYRIIGTTNKIIASLGGNDAEITEANKVSMAQAKTMRAYAYFYLTQLYIPEYSETSKILPLYLDANGASLPQSETKIVYEQMIEDLEQATTLLEGYNRSELYQVDESVASALLAYVYASMGTSETNVLAKTYAERAISASEATLTTKVEAVGGFNTIENNPSWIWGVDITTDAGLDLISWWGQVDIYTYSYQWAGDKKAIDDGLYAQIKPTDIRKTQFATIDDIADSANDLRDNELLIPFNKFYNGDRVRAGQRIITDDYIFMRIDEMYMLSAEMSAKESMDVDARNRLKDILSNRFDDPADYAYIDSLSGQALVDEIYLQTRIEFFAEGKSYLALKRNKATVTRGSNHEYLAGESFLYNDPKLTLEIPLSEIQNNPFIN